MLDASGEGRRSRLQGWISQPVASRDTCPADSCQRHIDISPGTHSGPLADFRSEVFVRTSATALASSAPKVLLWFLNHSCFWAVVMQETSRRAAPKRPMRTRSALHGLGADSPTHPTQNVAEPADCATGP